MEDVARDQEAWSNEQPCGGGFKLARRIATFVVHNLLGLIKNFSSGVRNGPGQFCVGAYRCLTSSSYSAHAPSVSLVTSRFLVPFVMVAYKFTSPLTLS